MSDRTKNKAGLAEKSGRDKIFELIEKGDPEQLENELSNSRDPALAIKTRDKLRRAAGWQKIQRLVAEGADEHVIEEQLSALPPPCPEERESISEMFKEELDRQACLQALRSSGEESPNIQPSFSTIALYYQLAPSDGTESVLAQMTTAIRDMTMECLKRASEAEAPVRGLELNFGIKGALIVTALTKALDDHRLKTEQIRTEKLRRSQEGRPPKKIWE